MSGRGEVRCWLPTQERAQMPEDLRPCSLVPQLHLSHLWIMGRDFGFVINVLDLCIVDGVASSEYPF